MQVKKGEQQRVDEVHESEWASMLPGHVIEGAFTQCVGAQYRRCASLRSSARSSPSSCSPLIIDFLHEQDQIEMLLGVRSSVAVDAPTWQSRRRIIGSIFMVQCGGCTYELRSLAVDLHIKNRSTPATRQENG